MCRHCHAWVALLEHPDAPTDAGLRGEIVWQHVDNGRSVTCPSGLTAEHTDAERVRPLNTT
jgi:hypothetical protein